MFILGLLKEQRQEVKDRERQEVRRNTKIQYKFVLNFIIYI